MAHRQSCTFAIVMLGVFIGCSADTKQGSVSGTVTLDGQPLKSGNIRFVPADGQTATADAAITDGQFTATMPPGEKKVSISAPKVTGKKRVYETPDSPMIDIVEELLPAEYNVRSTLTLNVAPGDQSKDFELKSAK
jgi:hypothetical protein